MIETEVCKECNNDIFKKINKLSIKYNTRVGIAYDTYPDGYISVFLWGNQEPEMFDNLPELNKRLDELLKKEDI